MKAIINHISKERRLKVYTWDKETFSEKFHRLNFEKMHRCPQNKPRERISHEIKHAQMHSHAREYDSPG